jgi:hypothetical protein
MELGLLHMEPEPEPEPEPELLCDGGAATQLTRRNVSHVRTSRDEVAQSPEGEGALGAPRTVVVGLQQQQQHEVTLIDCGIRGVMLSYRSTGASEVIELPLSFASIERDGPTLTVTVHAAVHPGCGQKGVPIALRCSAAPAAESWQREMERAIEQSNEWHWGISKSFMREQRERWEAEGQRCKGMTVAQYFEDIGHGEVYGATWGWCDGVLAALEAKAEKSAHDLREIEYYTRKVNRTELYAEMELTDYMNILKQRDLVPAGKKVMYAEFIAAERDSAGRRKVGKATLFVSHVWKMTAKDFFEVCLEEMAEDDYAWIDLYLHNQYQGAVSDIGDENSEYWIRKFGELIGGIKKVIAIVTNWEAPVMLTRIWCLFELNAAIETGADLRFVATAAERRDLSLNLNEKFQQLDRLVGNIEVRDCDAKRPHEIQDKSIFLAKLHGIEDAVNEKLRKEMRRWLVTSAEAVITRTDPYRPALDEMEMALEKAELGRVGAAKTAIVEKYPRLPATMILLSFSCIIAEAGVILPWLSCGISCDISNLMFWTTMVLMAAFAVTAWLARSLENHQLVRQLRAPPLFGRTAVRHRQKASTLAVLLGVITSCGTVWLAGALGLGLSSWQIVVPVMTAFVLLAVLVKMTLTVAVIATVARASLLSKVGWLRLSLGEVDAAVAIFRAAHAELLAAVGSDDPVSSYVAAPGYARALCESGRRDEALALVADVDSAAIRGGSWSPFDLRRGTAEMWGRYGFLVRAGMATAVNAPDADVLLLLSNAAQAGCSVPVGSRIYFKSGKGTTTLVVTEFGLREWGDFLQRMARGAGTRELGEAWASYTAITDELFSKALQRREKQRETDEQDVRNLKAFGFIILFLLVVMTVGYVVCPAEGQCVYFPVQARVALLVFLPVAFCVCRKGKPKATLQQEQRARIQEQQQQIPWDRQALSPPMTFARPQVMIACPLCQGSFTVQQQAGSGGGGGMQVQCPHCQAQLQF